MRKAIEYAWLGSGRRWDAGFQQSVGSAAGGLLVYSLGIKVPQEVLDNPSLGALVAIVVGGLTGVIITFALRLLWFGVLHHLRIRLNPYIAIAALGAVICAGGVIAYLWDVSRGPILWDYGGYWIGGGYEPGRPVTVSGFQFPGRNRWDDPIPVEGSYIRSDIDNTKIDLIARLKIRGGWDQAGTSVIPAGKEIILTAPVQTSGQPMTDDEFRRKFGRFSFFFNSKLVRRFYEKDVDTLFTKYVTEGRAASEN
jgi:hypothetical protein